ncbi:ladderlectin-like [Mastacembelus armatus]|uniref:ladderlectin-like n=1 Tax=Mastacembelus armatus TaxID=205130 RepID=UPI000E4638F7|nr:ladderlectin-like [Mastacembelus armatus]
MKTLILAALLCALLALTSAQGVFLCEVHESSEKNRCFTYVPRAMSWADAQKNCRSLDANLASVLDSREDRLIQKMIGDGTAAWLGGTDAKQEGNWSWTDGTPFRYTNWAPGQPDNWQGNENCLHITAEGKMWNDLNCDQLLPSFCIKNLF